MADTTGITKQHKLQFIIMYIYYLTPPPPRPPYFGIRRPRQNTYFATDHNRQNGKQTTNQNIKASKYHMRVLGTAAPNSNTINIILHNNSYLPAVQGPKWQQIFTSPNGQATNNTTIIICQPYNGPNGNQILTYPLKQTKMFKPEASTELWEQQPSE